MLKKVFYISDSTAITAEVFGHAVLSQFPIDFDDVTIPFVETTTKAELVKKQIADYYLKTGDKPLVFHSIVNSEIRDIIISSAGLCYDFLNTFVSPLELQLGVKASPTAHKTHSQEKSYDSRIDAINFTLDNDDGKTLKNIANADVILLGVSRCGKTPASLYLAMQFGFKVANYPFIEDDMDNLKLPLELKPFKNKIIGLTIEPQRLHEIRKGRLENSRYSSLHQCKLEIQEVEILYQRERIPFITTTYLSVEEITTKVIDILGLKRKMF